MAGPRKSYALWLTGHILRFLFTLFIFFICALLCWRVFFSGIAPKQFRHLQPNAALKGALTEHGALTLWTQEEASVTKSEASRGYFGVAWFLFVEEADQVQVLLRYNNSTLEHAQEDFKLDTLPPRGERVFDTTLCVITDTTPEDKSDNKDGSENLATARLTPTSAEFDTTLLYTYCLLTFDNVQVAPEVITIFLDIYFAQDEVDYTTTPYGTLRLYHVESERLFETLSAKEKKLIEAFVP